MRLSSKVIYACKAIVYLAKAGQKTQPLAVAKIAREEHIPQKYLLHILIRLKSSGIVKSERGAEGGYYLARSPSRITLGEIIKNIDDTILTPYELGGEDHDTIDLVLKGIWDGINGDLERKMDGITVEDILGRSQDRPGAQYYI